MKSYNNSSDFDSSSNNTKPAEVTKAEPCIHCGKPDWCYRIGELTVCKREAEPNQGWEKTSKTDKEGTPYYAPVATKKTFRPAQKRTWDYPSRDGSPLIQVRRQDYGDTRKARIRPWRWTGKKWMEGYDGYVDRVDIPIYRLEKVKGAIARGEPIFIVEGEPCADALRSLGLTATTNLGGALKWHESDSQDLAGAKVILAPDRDEIGVKHMMAIAAHFPNAKWLYAPPSDFYWAHLPASKGLDVADWIASGATKEDILAAVCDRAPGEITSSSKTETVADTFVPDVEENYQLKAQAALFSDTNWISIDKNLYKWVGTHYALASTPAIEKQIADWCRVTAVQTSNDRWEYKYATSTHVENILSWVIASGAVDPSTVNPPGINCLNGTLCISWQGEIPQWELRQHDPTIIYTYVSEFEFNPNADPTVCDRLLACLDKPQQDIFVKTLAASLDLKTIRKFKGRNIKALLCKGEGNNGKDSLREAVQLLYSKGVVSTTVDDYAQYQQGKKFALAKLDGARVSWSSENSNVKELDNIQPLKAAITGEELAFEIKNVQERPMYPVAVFFFNINNLPNLQASMEAIKSRWAVLSFDKVFKSNADPSKGELEADPRFRYDPNFIKREVVPSLLNKMLAVLSIVAREGIDYSSTEEAIHNIRRQTNHLWAFCEDVGLDYQPGGKVYVGDLYEKLQGWYIGAGYLIIPSACQRDQKKEWHEPIHRGDKVIKASKDLVARIIALFPQAKREIDKSHTEDRYKQVYIEGIGFSVNEALPDGKTRGSQSGSQREANGSQFGRQMGVNAMPYTRLGRQGSQICLLRRGKKLLIKLAPSLLSNIANTPQTIAPQGLNLDQGIDMYRHEHFDPSLLSYIIENLAKVTPEDFEGFLASKNESSLDLNKLKKFWSQYANLTPLPPKSCIRHSVDSHLPPKLTPICLPNVTIEHEKNGKIGINHDHDYDPILKPGDKCYAKHKNIYGLPSDKQLTVISVQGEMVTVTFSGCRSVAGVDVSLKELQSYMEGSET